MKTYILLFQCRDQKGIVAGLTDFIFKQGGNIINADQHSTDPFGGDFFIRIEFLIEADKNILGAGLKPLADKFQADFKFFDREEKLRMGLLVSEPGHCLADILYLWQAGELKVDIPFVLSNSPSHKKTVEQYGIPFHFVPANKDDRQENKILELVSKNTDFLVLARYMLVLSENFLKSYAKDIINIHHGFLPPFKGADPYRQALEQGVKVIGATAHFVNEKLDEGPIITQQVEPVTHKDDYALLVRKGRNLEKRALTDAVASYIDYRVIRHLNRTIVF